MINILMYGEDYEQDIRPLIKSFYQDEELQVKKMPIEKSAITKSQIEKSEIEKSEIDESPREYEFPCILHLESDLFVLVMREQVSKKRVVRYHSFVEEFQRLDEEFESKEQVEPKEKVKRRIYRNELHRKLYQLLVEITNVTLPWGTMTGIRPTKQILDRLEVGKDIEQIKDFLKREYYVSDEKIELGLQVANREQEILSAFDYKDGYSIYIGIPFCPSTCNYCSFTSYPLERFYDFVDPYVDALIREIEYAATCMPDKKLHTIYFGGGTPTTLSASQLDRVLTAVHKKFDFSHMRELTVEAGRPDSITRDKLVVLKEQGVDRISINPQSMCQKTLDIIGRKHTVEQIEDAFWMAREVGHTNINMDLIIGLSGETKEEVAYTLDRIKPLNPDSLTVHTLAIKRAARLNTNKEDYEGLAPQDVQGMFNLTSAYAKEHEYAPYYLYRQKNMAENLENIGYARIGKEGIYNILIMEEKQTILALGAGGSSKFVFRDGNRIERVENVKSLKDYVERVDEMITRKKDFLQQYGKLL